MEFIVLIPARLNSSRLPNKPLLKIEEKSLIQRVYENVKKSNAKLIYVATDHRSILRECQLFEANCILTSNLHISGTDRLAETASILELDEETIIVNVQGDEPFLHPEDINKVASLATQNKIDMGTLYSDLNPQDEDNPSVVKIWVDLNNVVREFSREKNYFENSNLTKGKHMGIYSYSVKFLKEFTTLNIAKREKEENLEQLRALSNNKLITAEKSITRNHLGIDTLKDLEEARLRLKNA